MLEMLNSSKLSVQLRAAIRDTPVENIATSHYFCIVRIAAALTFFSDLFKRPIDPPLTFRLSGNQINAVLKQSWLKVIEISGPTQIIKV